MTRCTSCTQGMGIEEEELVVWYLGVEEELTALSWGEFKTVFLWDALPSGYLWDTLAHIRGNHQGSHSYIDWSTELRQAQAEIGAVALSDLDLVHEMLFNMDLELRHERWQADVLKGSGYHEEEWRPSTSGASSKLEHPASASPLPTSPNPR
jgi:hypothetical protein